MRYVPFCGELVSVFQTNVDTHESTTEAETGDQHDLPRERKDELTHH